MRSMLAAMVVLVSLAGRVQGENWPGFRGPTGQGLSAETGVPLQWSPTENVAWKTPIPGQGWSSPIVWDDSVFVTTATDAGGSYHLVCLDRQSGQIRWNREVFRQDTSGRREGRNSFASSTPVTDGRLVYVLGFDGAFAAVSFGGEAVWTNRDFKYYSQHGLAVSLRLYDDLLIAPLDPSSSGPDKTVGWKTPWEDAVIVALDKSTGKVRWTGKRGLSRIAHVTPNILRSPDGDQLISGAGNVVQGFDLKTGRRLWSQPSEGEGVVPSIVLGDGLVFTCSGFGQPTIRAYRMSGKGDAATGQLAWEDKRGVPTVPSLIYVKPWLYSVTEAGIAMCRKGETGETVWQERLGGGFAASPVYAEGRSYFLSDAGETVVIDAGPQFKVLARNPIGEPCQASMAVSGRQFFIRSEGSLFCIGKRATD
jgi:outer membrane protein assembly factor BamB